MKKLVLFIIVLVIPLQSYAKENPIVALYARVNSVTQHPNRPCIGPL